MRLRVTAGTCDREAGLEHGQPRQVGALVAQRRYTAPDHIFNPAGLYPGALDRSLQDCRGQVDGRNWVQGTAWFSDPHRGTDGRKDVDLAHALKNTTKYRSMDCCSKRFALRATTQLYP